MSLLLLLRPGIQVVPDLAGGSGSSYETIAELGTRVRGTMGTTGTFAMTLPQTAAAGDLILLAAGHDKTSGGLTATGFTEVADINQTNSSVWVAGKIAAGGETSVTVSHDGTAGGSGHWLAMLFSGVDNTDWLGAVDTDELGTGARTSLTLNLGAADADGFALMFGYVDSVTTTGQDTTSFRPTATGWTWQATVNAGSSGNGALGYASRTDVTEGLDLPDTTFSWTESDEVQGVALLLRAATVGGGSPAVAYEPTVTEGAGSLTVTPDLAGTAASAHGPTVSLGALAVTPDAASSTAAALAPTVALPITVTPGVASSTAAALAPTVTAGALTVTPGVASSTAAALAPTVSSPLTVTPDLASSTAAALAPTVATPVTVTPGVATSTAAALAPTVTPGALPVTPGVASSTAAALAPTVSLGALTVTPGLAGTAATAHEPFVEIIGGPLTVAPGLAGTAASAAAPDVQLELDVVAGLASSTAQALAPTVAAPLTVTPDLAEVAAVAHAPTVTGSTTFVVAGFASAPVQAFAPDITLLEPVLGEIRAIGPGRSRRLAAVGASSSSASSGRSTTLTAAPRGRRHSAVGRSGELDADPLE